MKLTCETASHTYPIQIEQGILKQLKDLLPDYGKMAIVTDSGVPRMWVRQVKEQFPQATLITIPQGEASKNFKNLENVLSQMADAGLNRKSAVLALGGGVVGDLAGLCAALYMRGIDFYNVPTTILAQVDSSVGGKTAIDLHTTKNLVGAFWQPKAVYIDPDVLSTLSSRQKGNGLVEALKMGLILDEGLVQEFEKEELDLEAIIGRSIELKRDIVQEDEKEQGKRALLNFGHTIGHALEGASRFNALHGECVGQGMLHMITDPDTKDRVQAILKRMNIPKEEQHEKEELMAYIQKDKKGTDAGLKIVTVNRPGQAEIKEITLKELESYL